MPHNHIIFGVLQQTDIAKTATPTINEPLFASRYKYDVTNNDEATATIYSDYNGTNPPTTSRGDVASGDRTVLINTLYLTGPFTIYARAQASGKIMSNVTSYYVSAD